MIDQLQLRIHTIAQQRVGQEWRYSSISSRFWRLYWVADGSATVRTQSSVFQLRAPCLFFLPPLTIADYHCTHHMDHVYVHGTAPPLTGGRDWTSLWARAGCHTLEAQEVSVVAQQGQQLLDSWQRSTMPAALRIDSICRNWLAPFTHNHTAGRQSDTRLALLLDYIEANLHTDCALSELAVLVDMNPNYCSNWFRKQMGNGIRSYTNERRLARCLSLRDQGETWDNIAPQVGYGSGLTLARAWRRKFGTAK